MNDVNTTKTVSNNDILVLLQKMAGDVHTLKDDVQILKDDVHTVKDDVKTVKVEVSDVRTDLKDSMQMTSEGFESIDRELVATKERLDGIEGETRLLKGDVQDLKQTSYRHELQLNETYKLAKATHDEQLNMHSDINEIFHRLSAVEKRLPPRRHTKTQAA